MIRSKIRHSIPLAEARWYIFWVFGAGVIVEGLATAALGVGGALSWSYVAQLGTELLQIYSAPGLVLGAGLFATRKSDAGADPGVYRSALALCIFWNCLLALPCAGLAVLPYSPSMTAFPSLLEWLGNVSKYGGFLIAGVLAFFFAKPS